jgi:hypothetical protein
VWAGMSGSPVYINGDLAGALAYGFSFGATDVAGLTPAEDMLHIDGLPVAPKVPARIHLPRSVVRWVAAKIRAALPTVGGSLVRLKLPVSVSGVSPERYRAMRKLPFFKKYRSTMKFTHAASSSASLAGVVDDLVPGGNFAAALSYGDLTFAGVGTTTYVCDGQALAFGHPMLFSGKTKLGAGSADAITIVPDPLGPYKFANVAGPLGTLDQDRLAGVRSVDGEPPMIPVSTAVTSLDSALSRIGETDVVFEQAFPDLAFSHIFSNIDSVFDKIGPGSASYDWTIEGKREDGSPWELHKTNMYVSDFDLSFESAFEIYGELLEIANYPNEGRLHERPGDDQPRGGRPRLPAPEGALVPPRGLREGQVHPCPSRKDAQVPGDPETVGWLVRRERQLQARHSPWSPPRRGRERGRRLGLQPVLRRMRKDSRHV